MPLPLQPEFFALLGIDFFLAISLLTCLLDRHFPWQLPYIYQLAALTGFGQLLISKEFMALFGEYMRFWYSLLYLVVALANLIAVNTYLGIIKKLLNHAKVFMFVVTFPSLAIAAFFLSSYSAVAIHPFVLIPQMSWEATFIGIVAFDTLVVGLGTYVFFKPKWWYIAFGAGTAVTGASVYALFKPSWGEAAFVVSAIGLAIACIIVLGISVYVLTKVWIDTLKERKRRREVKK
ncbi:MAG: hypothetical protein OEY22_09325 [Candidatus Bathyarchaeota archaeon]|nr:hypothetical protein [Candidatus Bathyarchaeota archaeon]MDH5787367.1 hypothetical protein [Candidatus Bathyarchaeota archaeon]